MQSEADYGENQVRIFSTGISTEQKAFINIYNSLENVLKFIENMDKFIILTELKENKIHSFSENTPFTEYSKWFDELNEYVNQTYNELNQFIIESHLNKLYNDPDYEKKKAELMAMMSTPLSFNFREYSFNIDLQMSGNNRTI